MKEIIVSSEKSKKPIIPDQVLTAAEVEFRELNEIMAACPEYEWLDEPTSPNWPPNKGVVYRLSVVLSGISFAIKYRHFCRAMKDLERENRRRDLMGGLK
jgi:hypothetical protein